MNSQTNTMRKAARTKRAARPRHKVAKSQRQYTYRRGRDGVDDTWDIHDPYGKFVVSIRFWDDIESDEATETEGRAQLIVKTLNAGYWW